MNPAHHSVKQDIQHLKRVAGQFAPKHHHYRSPAAKYRPATSPRHDTADRTIPDDRFVPYQDGFGE